MHQELRCGRRFLVHSLSPNTAVLAHPALVLAALEVCCCSWTQRWRELAFSADHKDLPEASAAKKKKKELEETRSLTPYRLPASTGEGKGQVRKTQFCSASQGMKGSL